VLGRVMGIVLTADGVAEATAPMLVGYLRDRTGSYNTASSCWWRSPCLALPPSPFFPARDARERYQPVYENHRRQGHRLQPGPELRHAQDRDGGRRLRPRRRDAQRPRAGGGELPDRSRAAVAHRPRRAPHRGHLAVPLQRRLLAARTGDDDRDRRGRHGAVGHSSASRSIRPGVSSCSAAHPATR
jgi:hypothetical protein